MKATIKKILLLFMWYPLRISVRVLPPGFTQALASLGGRVLYLISKDKRAVMAEELRLIMPGKTHEEIEGIIRGSFRNYCISEMEVLLYPSLDSSVMERLVRIEGRENLDRELAKKKGVLLFQAHFGAFQMTMPAIGYRGYKMSQISASASVWKNTPGVHDRASDMKARYEYTLPVRHIAVGGSIRPAFRALERGEIVGITVDGGGGKKTVPVKFLGRTANFQTGGAELAVRTGAAVIPAFIITERGLKHTLIIHPPIEVDERLSKDERVVDIIRQYALLLEGHVYNHPEHYAYSLYLRRQRAALDPYPFFQDHAKPEGAALAGAKKGIGYA